MMVDEALARDNGSTPKNGTVGEAWPDWCEVGTIEVRSGKLTAIDFGVMAPANGATVEVAGGAYRVQARIMSFGGSLGICAARALPEGTAQAARGPVIGNVSVDIAKITIADIADAAEGLTLDDLKAISGEMRGRWNTAGALITLNLPSKSLRLPCIASGFGDGSYPAFALIGNKDNAPVGIEVEFVKDGHVYRRGGQEPDEKDALTKLDAQLKSNPANASARFERAAALYKEGKFTAAKSDLDAYLAVKPTDHRALTLRGLSAHFLNDNVDAIQFLNRAVEIQPEELSTYLHRSSVLKSLGRVDEAKADRRRWLSQLSFSPKLEKESD